MNRIKILLFVSMMLSCSRQNKGDASEALSNKDSTSTPINKENNSKGLSVVTDLNSHQASLKELSDSNVFSTIHSELIIGLSENHKKFFSSKPDYKLLSVATGDLFQNNTESGAFFVYDNKNVRVSILVFDGSKNKYSELYREAKVINGLRSNDCNFGSGSLDHTFAEEIIYHRNSLIKKPLGFLEYSKCKIEEISKDDNIILKMGCFSKDINPPANTKSLCIPTSFVYNNWECLTYDKKNDTFVIFYGQAFAD